ncbi:MAG TPA: right-handed parallel beta-helix repeat-containing protein [Roseiflexaceae bacterium]|jgi:CSLREA domain-containing protein
MTTVHTWRRVRECGVLAVAILLICLFCAASPAAAQQPFAIFIVNSTLDAPDANLGDGLCRAAASGPQLYSPCTLRAAIDEINAGSTTTLISLPAGQYQLTLGQLALYKETHISGAGADRTIIDGNHTYRVLDIASSASVDISGVMIQNGTGEQSQVVSSHYHGGGIHNHGVLTLRNSAISGNGADSLKQPHGGGIYNAGMATLVNVTISYNSATKGGGIYDGSPYQGMVLNNVTISGNLAPDGGGIYSSVHPYTYLKNSIVANNDGIWPGNNCQGAIYDGGYNLQYAPAAANGASCGAMMPVADPQLQPVLNGNGSAIVFALPKWSPAIDQGHPATPNGLGGACVADDQRFVARPQDGDGIGGARCDIGAYERRPTDP